MMDGDIIDFENVYPDTYGSNVVLIPMYCLEIRKDIAKECLNAVKDYINSQLHNNYDHLKRCKRSNEHVQILLGVCANIPSDIRKQVILINNAQDITIKKVYVSKHAPMTRKQYVQWSEFWPLYYRKPTNELPQLTKEQKNMYIKFLNISINIGKQFGTCQSGCILTWGNKIIACSGDNAKNHPLQHAVILAIEEVAYKLRHMWLIKKGVQLTKDQFIPWGTSNNHMPELSAQEVSEQVRHVHSASVKSVCSSSVDTQVAEECAKIGTQVAEECAKVATQVAEECAKIATQVSTDQYLCTNYYAYLSHEPCFMCAMAMVHSRITCVIFDQVNERNGALCSREKLHCVKALNHHFKVYKAVRKT
ncbi:cytidine deaminase, putative [Plasmodium ovale wallikeri]|uniref:Cytidine deaminase, putative n=1 Tax=Plasmodium ovale wallikeri TaxID=864142 RepID=A0A1A8YVS2_PLAOA|nr:cytidine deaminase, putative [Plasmodium ovale wallikeri]SBT44156.1 cytidine deaminase, putative [Plasmodium ovale wallikeri]